MYYYSSSSLIILYNPIIAGNNTPAIGHTIHVICQSIDKKLHPRYPAVTRGQ